MDVSPVNGAINIGGGLFIDNNEIQATSTLNINHDNNVNLVLNNGGGNVGIGVTSPSARLDIAGSIRIADGTQGAGKVLISDASGNATWQPPLAADSGWTITGNDMSSDVSGNVGIGTVSPGAKLDVKISDTTAPFRIDYSGNPNSVIDQSVTGPPGYLATQNNTWQSFTAGMTGELHKVTVVVGHTVMSMTMKIYTGEGPGGTLLASQNFSILSDTPTDVSLSLIHI